MSPDELFRRPRPAPAAVGTGLVALDVIMRRGCEHHVRQRPGGTCGNVLAILAYLGWEAHPAIRVGVDPVARFILRELETRGVCLDLVEQAEGIDTPVIIHRITRTASGGAVHAFSNRCPACKAFLPSYRPLLASSVERIADSLRTTQVFFFDRVSRGTVLLAQACADRGALVVFEPSSIKDPDLFAEAVGVAHVLKYSGDRLGDAGLGRSRRPLLIIETNGARGLRYRSNLPRAAKSWVSLPSFPAPVVRDAAGSGDWCTAGLVHVLGREGLSGFLTTEESELREGIRFGQALAALNCAHEGALGAIYDLVRGDLEARLTNILAGETDEIEDDVEDEPEISEAPSFCLACGSSSEFATM